jgi:hypothetical protein
MIHACVRVGGKTVLVLRSQDLHRKKDTGQLANRGCQINHIPWEEARQRRGTTEHVSLKYEVANVGFPSAAFRPSYFP